MNQLRTHSVGRSVEPQLPATQLASSKVVASHGQVNLESKIKLIN